MLGVAGASRVHEHPAHDPRGHREKVKAVLPVHPPCVDEPEVRLVHERRRLEALCDTIATEASTGNLAQFVMHQRDEARQRVFVSASPRKQERRDI